MSDSNEVTTLGGGCFWCLDAIFRDLEGVVKVESGYSGGTLHNPTYEEVCSGKTGHTEVVQLTFNPQKVSFGEILDIFFTIHDPTQLNRQGADIGSQYRSVIFYHSTRQKLVSEQVIRKLEEANLWKNPIVTEISPFKTFYRAEDYHQDYFNKNPDQSYCQFVIAPKIIKFRMKYENKLTS
ncbi:MAG: peptide-methionine (S)-S-oxide reductase MsrA [Candidatus Hodarchaeota archaeon]